MRNDLKLADRWKIEKAADYADVHAYLLAVKLFDAKARIAVQNGRVAITFSDGSTYQLETSKDAE
jgi:hypothetical protein